MDDNLLEYIVCPTNKDKTTDENPWFLNTKKENVLQRHQDGKKKKAKGSEENYEELEQAILDGRPTRELVELNAWTISIVKQKGVNRCKALID